jgi:hypothetical protein
MSDLEVQSVAGSPPGGSGLSQWQRVANIFSAPSKTFEDIKRGNRSWWLPLIIIAVVGYILFAAVALKIGVQQVVDNQIRLDPKAEERMAQASPAQREMSAKISLQDIPVRHRGSIHCQSGFCVGGRCPFVARSMGHN